VQIFLNFVAKPPNTDIAADSIYELFAQCFEP